MGSGTRPCRSSIIGPVLRKHFTQMPTWVALAVLSASTLVAQSLSAIDTPSKPPEFWSGSDPNAHVTVLENTLIRVMTNTPLSTSKTKEGTPLLFTLSDDVVVDHVLIIPRGASVHGTVVRSRRPGKLKGSAELVFELTSLDLGGRSYPLYTYQFKVEGASKTNPTNTIVKSAYYGAVVGDVVLGQVKELPTATDKAEAAGAGAAVGAGVSTLAAAATPAPPVRLPAESQMDFYLASPISVVPVTRKEAEQLSRQRDPGGPVLYVHGEKP
jgi:hypothetical protein